MSAGGRLLVVGAALLLIGFFAWEWYFSPRARVERFLGRVTAAVEDKDAERFLSFLSPEMTTDRGHDYRTLAAAVERGFESVDWLNVTVRAIRAEVNGARADASFDLIVVAGRGDERYLLVGRPMQPEKVRAELALDGSEWKIVRVERATLGP